MSSVKLFIISLGLLIGIPSVMWGQLNKINKGDKIRITSSVFSPSYRITGTMIGRSDSTLTFVHKDSTRELAILFINKLEVSTRKRRVGRGATIGAVGLGSLFGFAAMMAQGNSCDQSEEWLCMDLSPTLGESLIIVALGGAIGAGTGALIGSFIITERWEEVSLQISPATISMSSYMPGLSFSLKL